MKFRLYWTNLERYEQCPQKFLWYRGWEGIDLGRGPGKSKERPEKSSMHHAVMGMAIQSVLEDMYNEDLWKDPPTLIENLNKLIDKYFYLHVSNNYIDWRRADRFDMLQVVRDGVMGFIKTFKAHKLAGAYAKSEVHIITHIDANTEIGGKLDFLIKRDNEPNKGILILDGKNAKLKGKYNDPDQLRFYALCYYMSTGEMPDKLGFIYFRYPHGMVLNENDPPEEGVEWVDFTKEDLEALAARAIAARAGMEARQFEARPSPKVCNLCDFQSVCEARQAQLEAHRAKRKPKESIVEKDSTEEEDGFFTIS